MPAPLEVTSKRPVQGARWPSVFVHYSLATVCVYRAHLDQVLTGYGKIPMLSTGVV